MEQIRFDARVSSALPSYALLMALIECCLADVGSGYVLDGSLGSLGLFECGVVCLVC